MKTVNEATQMVVAMFDRKSREFPFDSHPYHGLLEAREKMSGAGEWTPELKTPAMEALQLWVVKTLGGCVASTMNEIVTLIKIADAGDAAAKHAAKEMSGSMGFLENTLTCFLNGVDIDYVAERLWAIGEELDAARKAPPAPTQTQTKQIQNWMPTRWNPSAN